MRNDFSILGLCYMLITCCGAVSAVPAAADGQLELVRDGRAVACIRSNGHDAQAAELRRSIRTMTGVDLPRVEDAPAGSPMVTFDIADSIPGLSSRATALQGYRLTATRDGLTLLARTEKGLTYAVSGLLEDHLGARFFAPDAEVLPRCESLRLDPFSEVREPAFQVRSTFMGLQHPNPWEIANRGGGLPADILVSRHGFYDWVHPSRYLDAHPEWYPLIDGKRQQHWLHGLCYTNPAVAAQLAANIAEKIRAERLAAEQPIPVGQGDGYIACGCETCGQVAKDNQSEAGPVILLLNRVLEALQREFPRHTLITFAYAQTIRPPRAIRPHPNLWVNIVSSGAGGEGWGPFSGGDMIGPIRGNPANDLYREAIEEWSKLAPGRVTIWHWATNFTDQSVEWPNLFTMADNIRFWREQDLAAVALQTTGGGGNWGWLKHWVWLKLMWNPDADVEKLVQEFLTGYYGRRAGPLLWEYHRQLERARLASGYAANACDSRAANALAMLHGLYPPAVLSRLDDLLDRAMQEAANETDPVYAARVAHARAYATDQLKLVEAAGVVPYPGGYFYPPETVKLSRLRDPRDGSFWMVPGSTPDMPARVDRRDQAMRTTGGQEWGAAYMTRFWFQRGAGGRLTAIDNGMLRVEVCPNLLGTITSIVHAASGKELLTGRFPLVEYPSGVKAMEWSLTDVAPRRLVMEEWLQTDNWFHMGNKQRYRRILELDGERPTLTIARRFEGEKLHNEPGMPASSSFPVGWHLLLPKAPKATLTITARGQSTTVTLDAKRQIDLPLPSAEADDSAGIPPDESDERVIAVVLDRGDGLKVRLTTPAAGWSSVAAAADPEAGTVALTFAGAPIAMRRDEHDVLLPAMRLTVE